MDPQKSSTPGVVPEGQNDQNEVSVNLSSDQAQGGFQAAPQDGGAAGDVSQAQPDFSTPAAPVADPGTSFSPTPVTDMQSAGTDQPAQQDVQDDLAQVATAQAGVEAPGVDSEPAPAQPQEAALAPEVPQVAVPQSPVDPAADLAAEQPVPADPGAAPTAPEAPASHNDKKIVIVLGAVAVVLLAAIAALYLL